ncbi:MAG: hypothetical protein J6V66_05410 [Clostridia bacterium]|nr:hypothetical protein [Clostridia bacterium]
MKKLIAKTIAFSVGVLVVGVCIFYLIMANFSPSTLSDFYFRMGNDKLTLKYSEKAYEKSEDISDLATLVERSIVFDNATLTKEYGLKLINSSDYSTYASEQDSGYKYYVAGSICEALYLLGENQTAIDTAFDNTATYSKVNPIRVLISLAVQNGDSTTLTSILSRLEDRQNLNEFGNNDISYLRDYLNL